MATVVSVLLPSRNSSSTPELASVMIASLRSGSISEMAPTKVVFPTPKPPATTIFTGVSPVRSEGIEAIQHLVEQIGVGDVVVGEWIHCRVGDVDRSLLLEIGDQDPHHPHRHLEQRRQLDDGGLTTGLGD